MSSLMIELVGLFDSFQVASQHWVDLAFSDSLDHCGFLVDLDPLKDFGFLPFTGSNAVPSIPPLLGEMRCISISIFTGHRATGDAFSFCLLAFFVGRDFSKVPVAGLTISRWVAFHF